MIRPGESVAVARFYASVIFLVALLVAGAYYTMLRIPRLPPTAYYGLTVVRAGEPGWATVLVPVTDNIVRDYVGYECYRVFAGGREWPATVYAVGGGGVVLASRVFFAEPGVQGIVVVFSQGKCNPNITLPWDRVYAAAAVGALSEYPPPEYPRPSGDRLLPQWTLTVAGAAGASTVTAAAAVLGRRKR